MPACDGEFGAAVALYSIIHLEPGELDVAFREVSRTLQPGGPFLLSFHVGSELRHLAEWWGHEVDVDFCFYEPEMVIERLEEVGFAIEARPRAGQLPRGGRDAPGLSYWRAGPSGDPDDGTPADGG